MRISTFNPYVLVFIVQVKSTGASLFASSVTF